MRHDSYAPADDDDVTKSPTRPATVIDGVEVPCRSWERQGGQWVRRSRVVRDAVRRPAVDELVVELDGHEDGRPERGAFRAHS